jgi:hypothetical protein
MSNLRSDAAEHSIALRTAAIAIRSVWNRTSSTMQEDAAVEHFERDKSPDRLLGQPVGPSRNKVPLGNLRTGHVAQLRDLARSKPESRPHHKALVRNGLRRRCRSPASTFSIAFHRFLRHSVQIPYILDRRENRTARRKTCRRPNARPIAKKNFIAVRVRLPDFRALTDIEAVPRRRQSAESYGPRAPQQCAIGGIG